MGEPSLDDSNVKVAVRVRPMNRRGEGASVYLMVPCLSVVSIQHQVNITNTLKSNKHNW